MCIKALKGTLDIHLEAEESELWSEEACYGRLPLHNWSLMFLSNIVSFIYLRRKVDNLSEY